MMEIHSKEKGLTVAELLVVVLLIGVLAVVGANFGLRNKNRWVLRGAGREIVSAIYKVKQRAASENRSIRFTISGNSYTYSAYTGSGWQALTDLQAKTGQIPDSVTLVSSSDFAINPRGTVIDPTSLRIISTQTIQLTSPGNKGTDTITLSIHTSGEVKIEQDFN